MSATTWRDRIVGLERIPAASLRPDPRNWREHPDEQRAAVAGVLEGIGIAGVCLVRKDADGTPLLIDGHLRSALLAGQDVPCLVLDVDAEEAGVILATHDPLGTLARYDAEALTALLEAARGSSPGVDRAAAEVADLYSLAVGPTPVPEYRPPVRDDPLAYRLSLRFPAGRYAAVRAALARVAEREELESLGAAARWLLDEWRAEKERDHGASVG